MISISGSKCSSSSILPHHLSNTVTIISVTDIIVHLGQTYELPLTYSLPQAPQSKILGNLTSSNFQNVQNLTTAPCGCCQRLWGKVHHSFCLDALVCCCILASPLSDARVRTMFLSRRLSSTQEYCPVPLLTPKDCISDLCLPVTSHCVHCSSQVLLSSSKLLFFLIV